MVSEMSKELNKILVGIDTQKQTFMQSSICRNYGSRWHSGSKAYNYNKAGHNSVIICMTITIIPIVVVSIQFSKMSR